MVARIAITHGEPAGIGPNLICIAAQRNFDSELVVFGSKEVLRSRAKLLNLDIEFQEIDLKQKPSPNRAGIIKIFDIPCNKQANPGKLLVENAPMVLKSIETAFFACKDNLCDALVTGPIHKAIINKIKPNFMGHTEFLQELAHSKKVMMTFYAPDIMLGLLTTHIPLSQVSKNITEENLTNTIELLSNNLKQKFKIFEPKIAILGLNPHAGENGYIGTEEQEIMLPTINKLRKSGINISDPISADTAFTKATMERFDFILAMYHDQGLAPFKSLFFQECVNLTLGLPIIRTSVSHGTALDLAHSKDISIKSFINAISLAKHLSKVKAGE